MTHFDKHRLLILTALSVAVTATTNSNPTLAQVDAVATLEEVLVTAQRREESLQETPIAVSAFGREKLDSLGILDVAELSAYVPNLLIERPPNANTGMGVFIRGIGTSETALMADPKIGMYIDDIYVSKTMGAVFDIIDIERMEVLRGPQGTLFGRNTTGGAISVTTGKPSGEFSARADASIGRFGYQRYGAIVDLPEVSNVAVKLSWYETETDGWARNNYRGTPMPPAETVARKLGSQDNTSWRIALRWTPTDALTIDYSFDRTDNAGVALPVQAIAVKNDFFDGFTTTAFPFEFLGGSMYQQMAANVNNPSKRQNSFNLDSVTREWLDVKGHSLTVAWDMDDITLKYILGHRETGFGNNGQDYNGAYTARDAFYGGGAIVPVPEFSASLDSDIEMTTHEFQIVGTALNQRLDYTAGLFLYEEEVFQDQPMTFALPIAFLAGDPGLLQIYQSLGLCDASGLCIGTQRLPLPFGVPQADPNLNGLLDFFYGQEMDSWAIYGQASYALTDALKLTGGLRYTEEKRTGFVFNEDFGHVTRDDQISVKDDWSNVSGVLNLSYRLNEDLSIYAKYTTGFNGGGFNARAGSANAFLTPTDEETVDSYELGLKSEWLDRRLRLNAALFRNDYTDIQITQFEAGTGGASSGIVNAGEGTYQGIEIDLLAMPVAGLTLDLTYGYLDAEFDEYIALNPQTDLEENISGITTVPFAPEHTAALGIQYDFPRTQFGLLSSRLDITHKSSYTFHPFQNEYVTAGSRTLLNGRLTLSDIALSGDSKGRLRVSLWGKNLTDEEYLTFGIDFGALGWAAATFGDPRSYGIDFRYEYN